MFHPTVNVMRPGLAGCQDINMLGKDVPGLQQELFL